MKRETTAMGIRNTHAEVPQGQRDRLFGFRATHPYRAFDVDGTTWRYLACGEGERALVFLPGAFLKADMWFNQILALERDYRIIAPDAYALQGVFDLERVCQMIVQTLDAEGIAGATVIGLSAGGGVAQALLQMHPERVEHAVFSHCGVMEYDSDAERRTKRILWLIRLLPLFLIRRILRRMTTGELPESSRWVAFHEAYMAEAIPNVSRAMFLGFLQGGLRARRRFRFEPTDRLSWPGSILILSSRDDQLSRGSVEKLKARYPRARNELLDAGGHHAVLLFPEEYTAALSRFLAAVSQDERR